jgi:hypothetical protein
MAFWAVEILLVRKREDVGSRFFFKSPKGKGKRPRKACIGSSLSTQMRLRRCL